MHRLDGYTIDTDCDLTPAELRMVRGCEDTMKTLYLDERPIGQVFPEEEDYCKKITGSEYKEVLQRMLSEVNPDPWKAAEELFFRYGEEYRETLIPGMTAYAMQDYVDKIAASMEA